MQIQETAGTIKQTALGAGGLTFGLAASTIETINHYLQCASLLIGLLIGLLTLWNLSKNRASKK